MSEPFISEIRMFGFNFAPRGWAFCNGQIMPITQNQTLYALVGPTYGGDGVSTFALPELRGRVPVHTDQRTNYAFKRGLKGGMENVALTLETLGAHTHTMHADGKQALEVNIGRNNNRMASVAVDKDGKAAALYGPPTHLTSLNGETGTPNGGGEVHNNVQPSQVVNFCIALLGIFPSRT